MGKWLLHVNMMWTLWEHNQNVIETSCKQCRNNHGNVIVKSLEHGNVKTKHGNLFCNILLWKIMHNPLQLEDYEIQSSCPEEYNLFSKWQQGWRAPKILSLLCFLAWIEKMAIDIMYNGTGLRAPTSKPWRVMDGTKCTNVLSTHLVHITGCANITPLVTSHGDTLIVWWVLRKGNDLYSKLSATTTIPRSLQDPFEFLLNSWFEILPLQHKSKLVMLLLVLYHKWWSGIKKLSTKELIRLVWPVVIPVSYQSSPKYDPYQANFKCIDIHIRLLSMHPKICKASK
jgi:hypothetical protein